jgi:hypothetical protein
MITVTVDLDNGRPLDGFDHHRQRQRDTRVLPGRHDSLPSGAAV